MKQNYVKLWMKKRVVSINQDATVMDAAEMLSEKKVGTLPVVDDQDKLVGHTTMKDVLGFFLPDFLELFNDIDFLKDFGALREVSAEDLEKATSTKIIDMMQELISVPEDTSPIRALSIMETHGLADLPVVKDEKLVGIVSRVDIGRAFLAKRFAKPKLKGNK
jgi:CBS domain-containing protein